MKELKLWQFILAQAKKNIDVILLCVLYSKGSSPGRQGFKMAVTATDMMGSIGGGIMEHKFVEMAKQMLQKEERYTWLKHQHHNKTEPANQSGMICSGEQIIFVYPVEKKDLQSIEILIHNLAERQNGTLKITDEGINFYSNIPAQDFSFEKKSETEFVYKEKTGLRNTLYIIGAGHCSLALSRLMSEFDFKIILIDDRDGLNTFLQNNFVHEKIIVRDYNSITNHIIPGDNVYVVVMTIGYRSDSLVVNLLLPYEFKYMGVLGSKVKIETLRTEWKSLGLDEKALQHIHAPIGINIKSQTPEEIAVSIVAQIIDVKNGGVIAI